MHEIPTMSAALRNVLLRRMSLNNPEALQWFQPKSSKATPRLFFVGCFSESNDPCGGHKMMYRHVDVLVKHGYPASMLHLSDGFRYSWFDNNTPITYLKPDTIRSSDILVIPETLGCAAAELGRGLRKVIYNQNCHYTFVGHHIAIDKKLTPYVDPEVVGVIVVSSDSYDFMRYAFPQLPVYRVRYSIDTTIFRPAWPKKKMIACMPRKGKMDLLQVINLLKYRGTMDNHGFGLSLIDKLSESETAARLGQSLIFLATSTKEGFGLPPAEAMACGCIVVGYHGEGGREFMPPNCTYTVPSGDVLAFAGAVERVILAYSHGAEELRLQAEAARFLIANQYNSINEETDIVSTWQSILTNS